MAANNQSDKLFAEGKSLLFSDKFEEAIKRFDEILKIKPDSIAVLAKKGQALIYLGRYKEAVEYADEGIKKVDAKDAEIAAEIRNVKGEALYYLGRYKEAVEYADEALRIHNNDSYSCYIKGLALNDSGEHKKAVEHFDRAISDPKNIYSDYYTNKGLALIHLNKYDEALECFDEAIKIQTSIQEKAYALINEAEILYKLKRKDKAAECYQEAIKCSDDIIANNHNASHSWLIKGISLFRLKWHDRATSCFDKVIDINPELDWAWYVKGLSLNHLGRYDEAINYFDKALEKNQNDPDYYISKGLALYELEKYDDAINYFDKAIELDPAYQIAYFKRGECHYRKKNKSYSAALEDYKRVDDPQYVSKKHNNTGLCYYQMGCFEKAEQEYRKAIEYEELVESYYNLAVLYNKTNQRDRSKMMLEKCLEIKPDFTKARDAIKEINSSIQSEWFEWWFVSGKGKKSVGIMLLISILTLIPLLTIIIAYISLDNKTISPQAITGIVIMVGFLVAVLLLPSLKKVKVLHVELETMTIALKRTELEVLLSPKVTFGSL